MLPFIVSGAALIYVFGYAIDWAAIPEATERANLPLFIAITILDKVVFFVIWAAIQASMVRRFIGPVPTRQILAVKGGAELVRAVNNSVSDAAFFLGVWQLCRAPLQAVVAVTTLPIAMHFVVLLLQASVAFLLAPRDLINFGMIATAVAFGWTVVAVFLVARRLGVVDRLYRWLALDALQGRVHLPELVPYFWAFAAFAAIDVVIQGFASRAFGNEIDWLAMLAGVPVVYLSMFIPSFGSFGTREIVWANLFHGYADEASLYAFALWTNVIFLAMHVLIGVLFFRRAVTLIADLRRQRREAEPAVESRLPNALDP